MKIYFRFLVVIIIALAGCGSTSNASVFKPAPINVDTTTEPKVVIPPADTVKKQAAKKRTLKDMGALQISILLPFNITAGEYKMPDVIADYYEGILLGLDSLKHMGLDVVVNVYDTKDDSATVKRITWKEELAKSDVIIGPTFKKGHAQLLQYVKPRNIALISPFSNANMWTDSNHCALYCTPDEKSEAAVLAKTIKEKYPKANILLVNDDTKEDKDFLWRFKLAAKELGLSGWKDITYKAEWDITPHLKTGDSAVNVIVAPTNNVRIAMQLLTQLKNPENNNILFVKDSWLNFDNINYQTYQLWQQNNLHVLTHFFVDDTDQGVINFKHKYKQKYGAMPGNFAFRGFDHIMSVGQAYYKGEALTLAESIDSLEYKGLHNNFKFRFNGKAMENQAVNVIRFVDYRFIKVK